MQGMDAGNGRRGQTLFPPQTFLGCDLLNAHLARAWSVCPPRTLHHWFKPLGDNLIQPAAEMLSY